MYGRKVFLCTQYVWTVMDVCVYVNLCIVCLWELYMNKTSSVYICVSFQHVFPPLWRHDLESYLNLTEGMLVFANLQG